MSGSVIERNKKIMGGAPVIKGTRVPISRIVYLIAKGRSLEDIIKTNYPFLSISDVKKALKEVAKYYNE